MSSVRYSPTRHQCKTLEVGGDHERWPSTLRSRRRIGPDLGCYCGGGGMRRDGQSNPRDFLDTVDIPVLSRYYPGTLTVRLDLRMPDHLHDRLKAAAAGEMRSTHAQALLLLREALDGVESATDGREAGNSRSQQGSASPPPRASAGPCSADAPRGMTCKICGQVHR